MLPTSIRSEFAFGSSWLGLNRGFLVNSRPDALLRRAEAETCSVCQRVFVPRFVGCLRHQVLVWFDFTIPLRLSFRRRTSANSLWPAPKQPSWLVGGCRGVDIRYGACARSFADRRVAKSWRSKCCQLRERVVSGEASARLCRKCAKSERGYSGVVQQEDCGLLHQTIRRVPTPGQLVAINAAGRLMNLLAGLTFGWGIGNTVAPVLADYLLNQYVGYAVSAVGVAVTFIFAVCSIPGRALPVRVGLVANWNLPTSPRCFVCECLGNVMSVDTLVPELRAGTSTHPQLCTSPRSLAILESAIARIIFRFRYLARGGT